MKAILKFDMRFEKWIIYIETDDGETMPVGKIINEEIGLFRISKWSKRKEAEEWIESKGLVLK